MATPKAKLVTVQTREAEAMPGVTLVRQGDFVGVAAPTEHLAARALAAVRAEWKIGDLSMPHSSTAYARSSSNIGVVHLPFAGFSVLLVGHSAQVALDAWFKADGSVEEAVEVMTATAKGLRRKYADRRPWAHAFYAEGSYLIGLGRCSRGPQLRFSRGRCDRLRHTLKRAVRRRQYRTVEITPHDGLWMTVDLSTGVLAFAAVQAGVDAVFRLNTRRCRELVGLLAPANLDRLRGSAGAGLAGCAGSQPDQHEPFPPQPLLGQPDAPTPKPRVPSPPRPGL
jgi:hypothetical protein